MTLSLKEELERTTALLESANRKVGWNEEFLADSITTRNALESHLEKLLISCKYAEDGGSDA